MIRLKYALDDGSGLDLENRLTARLYSGLNNQERKKASAYLTYYLAHPDYEFHAGYPQSNHEFGNKIGVFRYSFRLGRPSEYVARAVLWYLNEFTRRDALLIYQPDGKIIGHASYQIHPNQRQLEIPYNLDPDGYQLHMFQIAVDENCTSRALSAARLLKSLIKIAKKDEKIELLRFGSGSNPNMEGINRYFQIKQNKLGIEYLGKGYFRIKR